MIRILLALMLLTTPAFSQTTLYKTATWMFTGQCDSADLVYSWSISGQTSPGTWHILPWETSSITIRSVELTKISGGPNLWFMAGNAATPDAMGFMGPMEDHVYTVFPAGTGMPFPGIGSQKYLDLHGGCTGGSTVNIFYTVGYTVP